MVLCLICSHDEFYNKHGLYFCKNCETQTYEYHEEGEVEVAFGNEGDGGGTTSQVIYGRRINQPSQSQNRSTAPQATDEANEMVLAAADSTKETTDKGRPFTSFEAFQMILSTQTNQLIKLGFPQKLRDTVFKIWCIYLSEVGEAFSSQTNYMLNTAHVRARDASRLTRTHLEFIKKRKKQVDADDDDDEENEGTGLTSTDFPLTQRRYEVYDSKYAPNKLTMNTLLCILYLAISLTNPVYHTLSDIIRWIKDGTIPYFNADDVLPKDMKMAHKDHHMLTHLVLPGHGALRALTANLARYLNFTDGDFPALSIELLCVRYIVELNLPGELIGLTHSLLQCKTPNLVFTPRDSNPTKTGVPAYEAVAISYIIIVLRDLFGFHQQLECRLSRYAAGVQSDLPPDSQCLFNMENWMKHTLSREKISDLPQHHLDTQRFRCLSSSLDYYSAIAPPPSRYSNLSMKALKINTDHTRERLLCSLEQLSLGLEHLKRQRHEHQEFLMEVTSENSFQDTQGGAQFTSTQLPCGVQTPRSDTDQEKEPQSRTASNENFRGHSVSYLTDHRAFCERNKLVKRHCYESVREHVGQYIAGDGAVSTVTRALLSQGNYSQLDKAEFTHTTSIHLLFSICADFISLTMKELTSVFSTIEEAYICLRNQTPVDSLSSQYLYFPRPPK